MSRSKFKLNYIDKNYIKSFLQSSDIDDNLGKGYTIYLSRNSIIDLSLVDAKIFVHNGKLNSSILITKYMIGKKLGEFRKTRYLTKHVSKDRTSWKKK